MTEVGNYVNINDIRMYYEEYGTGYPLILIHGALGTGKSSWEKTIPVLAKHMRVIVPDIRSHGKTDNPNGELSYEIMSKDIATLIHELNLNKPIICGFSDGGQIALDLGIRYPDIAKALVVGGAVSKLSEGVIEGMILLGVEKTGQVNFENFEENNPKWVKLLEKVHFPSPTYWKTLLNNLAKMWLSPLTYPEGSLQNITIPTLLLLGDRDHVLGDPIEDNVDMFRTIPQAELAIIPNTGHVWNKIFTDFALDFILRQLN